MSIMQEYERFREQVEEKEMQLIEAFLTKREEYYLSDLLYRPEVWNEYEEWKSRP